MAKRFKKSEKVIPKLRQVDVLNSQMKEVTGSVMAQIKASQKRALRVIVCKRLQRIRESLATAILGYDVFISYGWGDGRNYAAALARILSRRYRVFIDDAEMHGGLKLYSTLGVALRRSSALAVVVTPSALGSAHVSDELRTFDSYSRPLIPIDVDGRLRRSTGPERLADRGTPDVNQLLDSRIWINEVSGALATGPSPEVIQRLEKAFVSVRRGRIRSVAAVVMISIFALAALSASIQTYVANRQRDRIAATAASEASFARTSSDPELSKLLAVAAFDFDSDDTSQSALLQAVAGQGRAAGYGSMGDKAVSAFQFLEPPSLVSFDEGGNGRSWIVGGRGSLAPSAPILKDERACALTQFKPLPGSRYTIAIHEPIRISPAGLICPSPTEPDAPVLWDVVNGEPTLIQPYRGLDPRSLAAHPHSASYVGLDRSGEVRMLRASDGAVMRARQPEGITLSPPLAIANQQPFIVGAIREEGRRRLVEWNYETGVEKARFDLGSGGELENLGLSADGEYVATEMNGVVVLRSAKDGAPVDLVPPLPDAKLEHFEFNPWHDEIAIAASEQLLYEGGEGSVSHEIWIYRLDERRWRSPQRFSAPRGARFWISSLAFSPDSRYMSSGDRSGRIIIWQLSPKHVLAQAMPHPASDRPAPATPVTALRFDPSGKRLVAGFDGGLTTIWDFTAPDDTTAVRYDGQIVDLGFNAQRVLALTMSDDGDSATFALREVRMPGASRETPSATATRLPPIDRTNAAGVRARLSPDGGSAMLNDGGRLRLWTPTSGLGTRDLGGHNVTERIEFSGDGRALAVRDSSGEVRVFAVGADRPLVIPMRPPITGGPAEAVALNFDGSILAVSEYGLIRLWDIRRNAEIFSGEPMRMVLEDGFQLLAFDRRGDRLASAGTDSTLRVWSVTSGAQIGPALRMPNDEMTALAIDSVGMTIATGHASGSVYIWDISPGHLRERACEMAGQHLGSAERKRFLAGREVGRCPD